MSVINRIEVCNFLNLDNRKPSEPEWRPHWRHVLLNLRGQSAAVVAGNAVGKSTLNRAIYAILTRDRDFINETRKQAAPKRQGLYSHIRIEVLYRANSHLVAPGLFGFEVPGEAYVLGCYGFADGDEGLFFYAHRGHLEDCPVVHIEGHRKTVVPNTKFRERLAEQPSLCQSPPAHREDWLAQVHRHFDPSVLHQLVLYQKAGGGDSAEKFFKVKGRGAGEDYDAAFFFAHIAPEVLVHCMDVYGEEGEYRFEDTMLESARPIIQAEQRCESKREELNRLKGVFTSLQKAYGKLADYREAQHQLARTAGSFLAEAHFLTEIVDTNPIPGVPRAAGAQHQPPVAFVINRLVRHESGEWVLPDRVIAEIIGSEAKTVNREAGEQSAPGQTLRAGQVVETPNFRAVVQRPQGGGPASIGYSRPSVLQLLKRRQRYAEGWNAHLAEQAINEAFEWRVGVGDPNPLYRQRRVLEAELNELAEALKRDQEAVAVAGAERERLVARIQAMEAADHELRRMKKSGLFSSHELHSPAQLQARVDQELDLARAGREAHEKRHVELNHIRRAYHACLGEYGEEAPQAVYARLSDAKEASSETLQAAQENLRLLNERGQQAENDWTAARKALDDLQAMHRALTYLLPKAEAFASHFPGETPAGLATRVREEERAASEHLQNLRTIARQLEKEYQTLAAFGDTQERFVARFNEEDPHSLVERVVEDLAQAQERERELRQSQENEQQQLTALQAQRSSLLAVRKRFGAAVEISRLERRIHNALQSAIAEHAAVVKEIEQLEPMAEVLAQFAEHFGAATNPSAIMRARQEQLELVTTEIGRAKEARRDVERQREELRGAKIAAGRVASQVMNALAPVGYARVHEVINRQSLSADRKALVLAHFSNVLHAPVADTLASAQAVLSALEATGLESPVFLEEGLIEFCQKGALLKEQCLVHSFMVGAETLQVQALIDPRKIEALTARIDAQLAEGNRALLALQADYDDLAPESETTAMVHRALDAAEQNTHECLTDARHALQEVETRLEQCRDDANDAVLADVRAAVHFSQTGGDQALASHQETLRQAEAELDGVLTRLPQLAMRASEDSLALIKTMSRYVDLGGSTRKSALEAELMENTTAIEQVESELPRLRRRAAHSHLIEEAAEFTKLGGHGALGGAAAEIEQASARVASLQQTRADVVALHKEASAAFDSAVECSERSLAQFHEWRERLFAATEYLDAGGQTFDATYEEHLEELRATERRADHRSRFNFALAQEGVDAEVDVKDGPTLQDRLEALLERITSLNTQIGTAGRERAKKTDCVYALSRAAAKLDRAIAAIIQQRHQARDVLLEIPPELIGGSKEAAGESVYLSTARQQADRLRAAPSTAEPELTAELAEELAGNTAAFPLNAHSDAVRAQRNDVARTLRDLKHEVQEVRSVHQTELSVLEREQLLPDQDSQRLADSVDALHAHFQSYLLDAERQHEHFQEDLEAAKAQLVKSVEGFTASVEENYKLLKATVKPQNDRSAGIDIDAQIVERGGIRAEIDRVIANIRTAERRRAEDASLKKAQESQVQFDARLKGDMRDSFYRGIFRAPKDSNASGPVVKIRHPEIAGGRALRLTEELSTGQANALALLILTKLADFALHRDARADVLGVSNRRLKPSSTRVIIIDGLFSNLSDRNMIRNSLAVVKALKGQFQLIGFIHSVVYENDPELFPSYVALRRVNKEHGFVLVENGAPVDVDSRQIAAIDFHADVIAHKRQTEDHADSSRDNSGTSPATLDGGREVAETDGPH